MFYENILANVPGDYAGLNSGNGTILNGVLERSLRNKKDMSQTAYRIFPFPEFYSE